MRIPVVAGRPVRRGATVVETGIVLSIIFLLLFGICEYARFLMTRQIMENAAREGARYAVVHTYDLTTAEIQAKVVEKLASQGGQLQNLTITVSAADPATGAALVNPSTGQVVPWSDSQFGQGIMVRISGDYQPALPNLLFMSASIPLQSTAVMYSEAN